MRLSYPRCVQLWAESYDEQHVKGCDPVHRPAEHFEALRIDPMRILEDHQHGILACQSRELRHQCFERSLPALFRGQIERRVSCIILERQPFLYERGILDRGEFCASTESSLSSFACGLSSCAS